MLSTIKVIFREQKIGKMIAAILMARALFGLLAILVETIDPLTASLYNRNIHDKLTAQPEKLSMVQVDQFVTNLLMIWCAVLVYSWVTEGKASKAGNDE